MGLENTTENGKNSHLLKNENFFMKKKRYF